MLEILIGAGKFIIYGTAILILISTLQALTRSRSYLAHFTIMGLFAGVFWNLLQSAGYWADPFVKQVFGALCVVLLLLAIGGARFRKKEHEIRKRTQNE